ncbi:protein PIN-LIKES 5 isoform X1 [Amborella trichopoda]|uniref:Auxin efflux carrier n=1 Tax=Amborella trichopoda TaxID=13333 RepID=W1P6D5_AMBTC|nr:protein PIN-LIKES 5 isoform X1 [Amborella trichopoda]ERN05442.1 hypothetical protein AMTR_s00007p00240820 [Amborella trichopoda]|eukprot:XP_020522421.1 protein PIN-LIKES 5 isoform X1 [Amborella trichopoda]
MANLTSRRLPGYTLCLVPGIVKRPQTFTYGFRNRAKTLKMRVVSAIPQASASLAPIAPLKEVFLGTAKTSLSLAAICVFVGLLQRSRHITPETPAILSQVTFRITVPCFLISKVSKIVALEAQWSLLSLPVIAILQVLTGWLLGKAVFHLMNKTNCMVPIDAWGNQVSMADVSVKDIDILKDDSLIIAACAFGNSVSLPLVILAGLLSHVDGGTAAGYVALYNVGGSPLLWSIGYQLFSPERKEVLSLSRPSLQSFIQFVWFWIRRILNPPIYGTLIGLVIGATPISYFFYPYKGKFLDIHQSCEGFRVLHEGLVLFCQSIMEASSLLGSATATVQTIILACAIGPLISDFGLRKGAAYETETESGEFNREKGYTIVLDKHIFWAIICIRLIGIPFAILFLVKGLLHMGLLPKNTILVFTVLVVSAMPTAQNLAVMLQLNPSKAPLVETFANLLLYEYALALVSIPIWTTLFTALFSRP